MKKNEIRMFVRMALSLERLFLIFGLFVLGFTNVLQSFAQTSGTTGSAITFDANNSTMLFSDLDASLNTQQKVSCYLRHNQAPIQIINANPASSSSNFAPLESNAGTGTGFFDHDNMANNMEFVTNGDKGVSFFNFASHYQAQCFAIIAPKGYRFTSYYMDICSNPYSSQAYPSNVGAKGATIERYTYIEGSKTETAPCSGEVMTLSSSGANSEIFQHTLTDAGNILYFMIDYKNTSQHGAHLNKLRLTYVIDSNPVEVSIPTDNKSQFHSGYIDLGSFNQETSANDHYFKKANVTDWETINIVGSDGTTYNDATNGVFYVPAGTFYMECPANYRITGAELYFTGTPSITYSQFDLSSLYVGEKIKCYIQSSASSTGTNCMTCELNDGSYVIVNKKRAEATLWTITRTSNSYYTIYSEKDEKYLTNSGTNSLTMTTTRSTWQKAGNYNNFYISVSASGGSYTCYLTYSSGWKLVTTNPKNDRYIMQQIITTAAGEYDATIFDKNGSMDNAETGSLNSDNPLTLSVSGFNNDAVKFSVSDAAAFTAKLYMVPLDPYLQNLDFTYKNGTADADESVSVASTNFSFNNGEDIVLHFLDNASHQAVFRNAYNENRSEWYGTAEGSTLSNYFLVGSAYETSAGVTVTPVPGSKVNADQAGKDTQFQFSNIKELTSGGGKLTENSFDKSQANLQSIILTAGANSTPVYIYSADEPENKIITNERLNKVTHVAYTFYDAKLKAVHVQETPSIAVTELYTSSIKGDNNKNSAIKKDSKLDTTHKFYGVKVTSDGDGYLTIDAIKTAIEEAMAEKEGIYENDVLRTILYVDMSSLKSVAGKPNSDSWHALMFGTADNCLFFMPENYSNIQDNVIAGGEGGRAVGDIIVQDQQPFYSCYNFNTGTRKAQYQRIATNGQSVVPNTTLILPFSVLTDESGYAKTSIDKLNKDQIAFYSLNSFNDQGPKQKTYGISATAASNLAPANKPYQVVIGDDVIAKGTSVSYLLEVLGASFVQTPGISEIEGDASPLTGYGSFNGIEKPKATTPDVNDFLYFTNNYFWKSSTYSGSSVKFLPYRVYYTYDAYASNPTVKSVDHFSLPFGGSEDDVDAIQLVNSDSQLLLDASNGVLYVKTNADTDLSIYDMSGRRIVSDHLTAGNTSQYSLSKGVYIANGKKILVK